MGVVDCTGGCCRLPWWVLYIALVGVVDRPGGAGARAVCDVGEGEHCIWP